MDGNLISTWLPPLILIGGVALLIWRFFKRQARRPEPHQRRVSNPYHCVAIAFRKDACRAARGLNRQRMLSREAPLLPLPGCDAKVCRCKYVHYDDRREDDRRHPLAQRGMVTNLGAEDRRTGRDRRRTPQLHPLYER